MSKNIPILFNTAMVHEIMEDNKTHSRRPMKVQPPSNEYQLATLMETTCKKGRKNEGKQHWIIHKNHLVTKDQKIFFKSPFGKPGDILYVREAFGVVDFMEDGTCPSELDFVTTINGKHIIYREKTPNFPWCDENGCTEREDGWPVSRWKPSIHMPKEYSRISLRVKRVWIERVQDITHKDCLKEGVKDRFCPIVQFHTLWNSIYTCHKSWGYNPWVWACEFERIKKGSNET